jgi:hypothetical protein
MSFTTTLSGDYPTRLGELIANDLILWATAKGNSRPANYVEGTQWLDDSASANVQKIYANLEGTGAADYEQGSIQHADLKFVGANGGELKFAKAEQLGSDPATNASKHGRFWQRTDTLQFRCNIGDASQGTIVVAPDTGFIRTDLPLGAWVLGGTPPAAQAIGSAPATPALRFTSTSMTIACSVRVPAGYNGTGDLKLRCLLALGGAQTASHTLDVTGSIRSVTPANPTDNLKQTATTIVAVSQSIGSNNQDAAVHVVDLVLDYDDSNNPIAPGDLLGIEFKLNSVASIATVDFLGAELLSPFGTGLTE